MNYTIIHYFLQLYSILIRIIHSLGFLHRVRNTSPKHKQGSTVCRPSLALRASVNSWIIRVTLRLNQLGALRNRKRFVGRSPNSMAFYSRICRYISAWVKIVFSAGNSQLRLPVQYSALIPSINRMFSSPKIWQEKCWKSIVHPAACLR